MSTTKTLFLLNRRPTPFFSLPADALLGHVAPYGHTVAGASAADVIADHQIRSAITVYISDSTAWVVAVFNFEHMADELSQSLAAKASCC